ncbi:MAG: asparaginase, partial [Thermoleophilia bacterium]|nr:asparaginase [Thermoleophilia bacterium]
MIACQAGQWDAGFEPLAATLRGGQVESVYRGALAVVDTRGELVGAWGDPDLPVFLRSAAKPFQALALVESGAADAWQITAEELAVICGSHSGQPEHIAVVAGLLARLGISPEVLTCGSLAHTCSGKHAGMLALALHLGVDYEGYADPNHPVQQAIAHAISRLLALRTGSRHVPALAGSVFAGPDGCGTPVVRVSLADAAFLYALLGVGATPGLKRVRDAMLAHPQMVGGPGRLDTEVMQRTPGLVVKSGAEGVLDLTLVAGGNRGA